MSLSFADGIQWLKNKVKKVEGYRGIMGPITEIDNMNASDPDFTNTATLNNNLAQGIATYNTKYDALRSATNNYLGMTANYDENKNYNIYVNNPIDYGSITATPYTGGGCISNGTSNSALSGLTDATSQGFDTVYPANFPNTPAGTSLATNACKLWAADTQVISSTNPTRTWFALTKDAGNKFKCFTGNSEPSSPNPYTIKKVAYKIASSNDATHGGLFMDGKIGVYNTNTPLTGLGDTSNPKNIETPFTTPLTKYTKCDKWGGGAINSNSVNASLGVNCSNYNGTPVNMRYILIKASTTSPNPYPFIQISQLAVFSFENGTSKNVSSRLNNNKAVAFSGNGANYSNLTNASHNNNAPPSMAIDGNLSARHHPLEYHSATPAATEWWGVDLGREYPIYEIVYYNRNDCCSDRAIGMTIHFIDAAFGSVSVKDPVSGNATQTITIPSAALEQKFTISKP